MIRLKEIFRGCTLRRCAVAVGVAAAAVIGCSKEDTSAGGYGEEVLVRLPGVSLESPVTVVPGAGVAPAESAVTRGIDGQSVPADAADTPAGLFSVRLGAGLAAGTDHVSGDPAASGAGSGVDVAAGSAHAAGRAAASGSAGVSTDADGAFASAASAAPATRADVALKNVWVFQFNAAGKTMRCEKVDALAAGRSLEVKLNSGWGFTIGVVANGPASGLSTSNVPDLATFREGQLFTSSVSSLDAVPYAGTLDGVSVFTDGRVQVGGSAVNLPYIQLRRILAQVTVELTHDVDSYVLDGVELYNVPVGAAFVPDRAAAAFPSGAEANFGYRDNTAAGLAPHAQGSTGGNGHSYTWYIGQNRRGRGTGITKVQDKNGSKAPAYATYARVKTHHATVSDSPLYYDIYLGEDMFADFNVTANHVYVYDTRIVGSADEHYTLLDTDGRVSGTKPYALSTSSVTPAGAVRPQGGTYTVTLSGLLPSEGVEVRANISGADPVTGKVTASGKSVSLTVPPNGTNYARDVRFEYKLRDTWVALESDKRSQGGYYLTSMKVTPAGDIPTAGGEYTLTLQCWGWFYVRAVSGGTELVKAGTQTVDPNNETKIEKLTVPANTTGAVRDVTFQASVNGRWYDYDTRKQAGIQVTKATHNAPSAIPGQGGTYSVTLEGTFPAGGVTVHAATGNTVLDEGKVTSSGQSVQLKVPANMSYSGRTIKFTYNLTGSDWPVIGNTSNQLGYHVDKVTHNMGTQIPAAGGTYQVTFEGWGDYQVRAMSGSTQVAINSTVNADASKTVVTHDISIPSIAVGTNRNLTIQYYFNGSWKDISPQVLQQTLYGEGLYSFDACVNKCNDKGGVPNKGTIDAKNWTGWKETVYVEPAPEDVTNWKQVEAGGSWITTIIDAGAYEDAYDADEHWNIGGYRMSDGYWVNQPSGKGYKTMMWLKNGVKTYKYMLTWNSTTDNVGDRYLIRGRCRCVNE